METISFGARSSKPPLLFVHGSYCGAWIWTKYFLPYFAEAGHWGAAISLRGHGKSGGTEWIDFYGLNEYLADITSAVEALGAEPVLVGHSLGGFLGQLYALQKKVAGLALLCAPALTGLAASAQHIALHSPGLAFQLGQLLTMGPSYVDARIIGQALFSKDMPEAEAVALFPLLQRESRRITCEAYWPQRTIPVENPPRTLVLSGDADALIPESDFKVEAEMWHAERTCIPALPHGFMMDTSCWRAGADALAAWLRRDDA